MKYAWNTFVAAVIAFVLICTIQNDSPWNMIGYFVLGAIARYCWDEYKM